jgi:hypothetical protein
MKGFCFLMVALTSLAACSRETSFRDAADLEKYVNDPDNGYISSVSSGNYLIETRVIPAVSADEHPQLTVHMRISRNDGGSVLEGGSAEQESLDKENYMSFQMLGDVYLENGDKAEPAVFHHYERNFGLKPSIDVFFDFNHFTPAGEAAFVYRDQLFGLGRIRIPLDKELFTICHVAE